MSIPSRTIRPPGRSAVDRYLSQGGREDDVDCQVAVALLGDHAPALVPLVLADLELLPDVLARPLELPLDEDDLRATLAAQEGDEEEFRATLRRHRHRGVVRIALREVLRLADIDRTSAEMAALARTLTHAALQDALSREAQRFGRPLDAEGEVVEITCLGMGKLGGGELNLGSDIDLIFFYRTDDAQIGDGTAQTPHDYFSRAVRRACSALSEVTDQGFCFRVDLRLRPEGSRGPVVNSLASAERYYTTWGRPWERAALLRASPIAGDLDFGQTVLAALRPFVYRREVDPTLPGEFRELLDRGRREHQVDLERDVKLGRGGIREAEFFVQALQLIWAGKYPELRVPATIDALHRLHAAGLVTDREVETLEAAWALLRRVEHRIHVWTGYQTHCIPVGAEHASFTQSLGFDTDEEFHLAVNSARDGVQHLWETLSGSEEDEPDHTFDPLLSMVSDQDNVEAIAERIVEVLPVRDAYEAAENLRRLGHHASAPLGEATRARLPELGRFLLREIAGAASPDQALRYLSEFFARLRGRWSYERLLLERPHTTRRLLGLFGASRTLAEALVGHPEDLDLVLVFGPPDAAFIDERHDSLAPPQATDQPELIVEDLRAIKRAITLQLGVGYTGGELPLADTTARLSALAERQLRACLHAAVNWAKSRFGNPDPTTGTLAVLALGKLGGRELGFHSDLDLIFFYGGEGETDGGARRRPVTHGEFFARVTQKTLSLLNQASAEGPGYVTDTRLRPSGAQGTLVTSLSAFDAYHARSSAGWERQALIRARAIAGDERLSRVIEARCYELAFERGPWPASELASVRQRLELELAGENRAQYHPKLGYGGLIDVELLVQWLQMRHGNRAPDPRSHPITSPNTLTALEGLEAQEVIPSHTARELEAAFTFLRRTEQTVSLFELHREPYLEPAGRTGAHVARSLRIRDRDGLSASRALDHTYRRHALNVRRAFEAYVSPVESDPPWGRE